MSPKVSLLNTSKTIKKTFIETVKVDLQNKPQFTQPIQKLRICEKLNNTTGSFIKAEKGAIALKNKVTKKKTEPVDE